MGVNFSLITRILEVGFPRAAAPPWWRFSWFPLSLCSAISSTWLSSSGLSSHGSERTASPAGLRSLFRRKEEKRGGHQARCQLSRSLFYQHPAGFCFHASISAARIGSHGRFRLHRSLECFWVSAGRAEHTLAGNQPG